MLRAPDGEARVELTRFHSPPAVRAEPEDAPANALRIRRLMFAVDGIYELVERLADRHGATLLDEIVHPVGGRLPALLHPRSEGVIIGLAEAVGRRARSG